MFTSEDVLTRVRRQPFVPIRFITSSGEHYDVHHPEMVWVGKREIQVGTASKENPAVYERAAILSLLHITALEDAPRGRRKGKANGNGRRGGNP